MTIEPGHTIKVHEHGYVRFIDHMGTDTRIVEAARISYHSASKGPEADKKLLRYLLMHQHSSPFEQCKVAFNIKMPIFVMRQYVRHRMQNLNEVSARYTELPNEFYLPEVWRIQDVKNKQGSLPTELPETEWQQGNTELAADLYASAYATYTTLLERGVARELARIVLPVGIYTEVYSCWDLNNLLKFFALRDDPHAQKEFQDFAKAMKQIVRHLFPWTMDIYENMMSRKKEAAKFLAAMDAAKVSTYEELVLNSLTPPPTQA